MIVSSRCIQSVVTGYNFDRSILYRHTLPFNSFIAVRYINFPIQYNGLVICMDSIISRINGISASADIYISVTMDSIIRRGKLICSIFQNDILLCLDSLRTGICLCGAGRNIKASSVCLHHIGRRNSISSGSQCKNTSGYINKSFCIFICILTVDRICTGSNRKCSICNTHTFFS